jgi:NhaP-type Na+/H+ or K+/H+ antiporter
MLRVIGTVLLLAGVAVVAMACGHFPRCVREVRWARRCGDPDERRVATSLVWNQASLVFTGVAIVLAGAWIYLAEDIPHHHLMVATITIVLIRIALLAVAQWHLARRRPRHRAASADNVVRFRRRAS